MITPGDDTETPLASVPCRGLAARRPDLGFPARGEVTVDYSLRIKRNLTGDGGPSPICPLYLMSLFSGCGDNRDKRDKRYKRYNGQCGLSLGLAKDPASTSVVCMPPGNRRTA